MLSMSYVAEFMNDYVIDMSCGSFDKVAVQNDPVVLL